MPFTTFSLESVTRIDGDLFAVGRRDPLWGVDMWVQWPGGGI